MTKAQKKAEAQAFLEAVGKAMKAAAKEARRVARMHGTKVWVMNDDRIAELYPWTAQRPASRPNALP